MFEEAISLLSVWASMNTWLTPTVLFLLLNLMIGTIAVTSGFTSYKPSHHHPDPSFHHPQSPQQLPQQPHLSRSASVLQRLKSINFYSFYSHRPTAHFHQPSHPPPQKPEPELEPSRQSEPDSQHPPSSSSFPSSSSDDNNDESPTLDEIYSRIKQEKPNPLYGRQNSDTKPSGGEVPVKLPKKMMKSASDKSAFNHFHFEEERENAPPPSVVETVIEDVEVEEERENNAAASITPLVKVVVREEREDEGVDAKADDFINRFRKQLQMQRNDSIVRSYKEMISRTSVN